MADYADGSVTLLSERWPTAKKEHKCSECYRIIKPGEKYLVERYIFDGAHTHKTCAHCHEVRCWLADECGGWLYGQVEEDIREHAHEGYHGLRVKMMAVGMERKWLRKDGRMWPIPKQPKTTHEKMKASA